MDGVNRKIIICITIILYIHMYIYIYIYIYIPILDIVYIMLFGHFSQEVKEIWYPGRRTNALPRHDI